MSLTDPRIAEIDLSGVVTPDMVTPPEPAATPVVPAGFELIGGDVQAGRSLAQYVNLRTQIFWMDSLSGSAAGTDEARLYAEYLPQREALLASMAESQRAFIDTLQSAESQRMSPEEAAAQFAAIDAAMAAHLEDSPRRAQDPANVFDYLNGTLDLEYSLDEVTEAEYEREMRRRTDLQAMLFEIEQARDSGGSIFRIFGGLGQLDVPTMSISDADAMGAARDFLARTNAEGLTTFSPEKLAEQQAILGVLSQAAVEQMSMRSAINIGVHTVAAGVPELVAAMSEAGAQLSPQGFEQFISSDAGSAFADLGDDLRNGFNEFLERGGEGLDRVNYRVTQQEIVRINSEVWQLMVDGRQGQYMGYDVEISREMLEQLPESVRTQLGDRPKLYELAMLLDPQIRPLATMYTGAMAHAPAQNYQRPYDMNFHDVGLWGGAFQGQVAPHMQQYAIPVDGTAPETAFDISVRPTNPYTAGREAAATLRDTVSGDESPTDVALIDGLPARTGTGTLVR